MALKSTQFEPERAEQIEESLDELDTTLDRLKVLYEQYFLGMAKQAPAYIHTDVERKIRELTQLNIRNTGLRYRFNTLQQKFGSYNAYWRRTLRQIEHGTYARNLVKVGRKAAQSGDNIPDEILAAMPKRMRDQVLRDREAALALAKRQKLATPDAHDEPAVISEPPTLHRDLKRRDGSIAIDESGDLDLAALAAAAAAAVPAPAPKPKVGPPPIPAAARTGMVPIVRAPTPVVQPPPERARTPSFAPSQQAKPLPIMPGATSRTGPIPVVSVGGRAAPRDTEITASPAMRPPPGMSEGDVDALYTKYVAAKKLVGEDVTTSTSREKLLRTINAQAPKIMQQYKAKGVDFSVVVKDNQVIIRAKPKP